MSAGVEQSELMRAAKATAAALIDAPELPSELLRIAELTDAESAAATSVREIVALADEMESSGSAAAEMSRDLKAGFVLVVALRRRLVQIRKVASALDTRGFSANDRDQAFRLLDESWLHVARERWQTVVDEDSTATTTITGRAQRALSGLAVLDAHRRDGRRSLSELHAPVTDLLAGLEDYAVEALEVAHQISRKQVAELCKASEAVTRHSDRFEAAVNALRDELQGKR